MKSTPVMNQYLRLKQEAGDAILFFRMGDFYEMFMDDAVLAAELLELTLTSRDKQAADPIPMAGVPWHSAGPYIAKLLQAGHRVALCEQIEQSGNRGLMEREIVEILTPGTAVAEELIEGARNLYLAAVAAQKEPWGLALADVSTGEFLIGELPAEVVLTELEKRAPRELLLASAAEEAAPLTRFLREHPQIFVTGVDDWLFSPSRGSSLLQEQYGVVTLEPYGLNGMKSGLAAAGALLAYAREQRRSPLGHLRAPSRLRSQESLVLDEATLRNLEVLEPLSGPGPHALLPVLDATCTAMGARALRRALSHPLADADAIRARHAAVTLLYEEPVVLGRLREHLRGIADLERLVGRLHCGRGSVLDLGRLRDGLEALPELLKIMGELGPQSAFPYAQGLDPLPALRAALAQALLETRQLSRQGPAIREGFDEQLDAARALAQEGEGGLAEIQAREREASGIGTLKVGHNKVFGYYLEVTRAHLARVPEHYERKQTLVGGERFVTPELKHWEERIATAQERLAEREGELIARLQGRVRQATAAIQRIADALSSWDLLACFAARAREYDYVRPEIDEGDQICIRGGRHPVVERFLEGETFVPNDIVLDGRDRQVQILTGPNMAGKSTFLRQIGLLVLMAQAGSYVPAREAQIGVADRIFTRVGARDDVARGRSTFLVEMIETSAILHGATRRSVVLLDEIGRGTSTYDGLAIAWAVAEHLRRNATCRPRTLFATHFHELTALARRERGYVNLNVLVKEWREKIVFVRRVAEGAADRSYGVHVARLAGLPEAVLERARALLRELERHGRRSLQGVIEGEEPQMPLFDGAGPHAGSGEGAAGAVEGPAEDVAGALAALEVEKLSGVEALGWLERWQRRLRRRREDG